VQTSLLKYKILLIKEKVQDLFSLVLSLKKKYKIFSGVKIILSKHKYFT